MTRTLCRFPPCGSSQHRRHRWLRDARFDHLKPIRSSVAASNIHVTGFCTAHHVGSRIGTGWGSSTSNAKFAG
jgi:hypothetical protein